MPGPGTVKIEASSLRVQAPDKTLGAVAKTSREPPIQTVYKEGWSERAAT